MSDVMPRAYISCDELISRIQKYHPDDDMELVRRAYDFAEKAHAHQVRKSGDPYFSHPVAVAVILTDLMLDATTIAAGLLHDCVEDVEGVDQNKILELFGQEVELLVDGVTKLNQLDFANREEAQAETLRKMFLAMAKDIRVVLIKLADRLHNMRTLKWQRPERQVPIARETLDIYAPLAHRLGVYTIKWELEDLALRYIDPEGYYELVRLVGMKREEREQLIAQVTQELKARLNENGIKCEIDGRPKHFYSIYKKMKSQNKTFDQINDLIAIRVLVNTQPDCYFVLGIVHTMWPQVPGRFKDYISMPKANMYQSLHTTVVNQGRPFEVQIRTFEMHRTAEYGIAAHWRYKEGSSTEDNLDHKLFWVRQMLDWQTETRDSREFLDTLKTDLFSEEVFLFTPKGDVISMPKGATPLDFAYRIHSAVGNQCVGARVNGKIVPLDTTLTTGDRVEIITSASSKGPGTDWLRICKTPQAKAKIRQFLKKSLKEENIELGRDIIEKECARRGVKMSDIVKPEYYEPLLRKYGFLDFEDICGAVGYGGMAAMYVVSRLVEEQKAKEAPPQPVKTVEDIVSTEQQLSQRRAHHGIVMTGSEDLDIPVRFAKCCSPVPGDEIVGYITRGRGVTIHKAECVNIASGEDERKVAVEWAHDGEGTFSATITVLAYDRVNMLGEIAMIIGENGVSIRAASIQSSGKTRISTLRLTLDVHSREEMDRVINALRNKSDILDVYRTAT